MTSHTEGCEVSSVEEGHDVKDGTVGSLKQLKGEARADFTALEKKGLDRKTNHQGLMKAAFPLPLPPPRLPPHTRTTTTTTPPSLPTPLLPFSSPWRRRFDQPFLGYQVLLCDLEKMNKKGKNHPKRKTLQNMENKSKKIFSKKTKE